MLYNGLISAVAVALVPPPPAPLRVNHYEGLCEASAAVRLDGDRFAMASDEADKLKGMEDKILIYRRGGGGPVGNATIAEVRDLEAAAAVGDGRIFWITSHSLNKDGEDNSKRRELVATSVSGDTLTVSGRYTDLRKRIAVELGVAEWLLKVPLNIEGMAATTEGDLLLGLRAPLNDGKAGVVRIRNVSNPAAAPLPGAPAQSEGSVRWLDLKGRGIRSIERAGTGARAYLIVAGATGEAKKAPALFWWDGASDTVTPGPAADLRNLTPEAAIVWGDGTIEIFGDNESRCSDEDATEKRWFPSVVIRPEPAP